MKNPVNLLEVFRFDFAFGFLFCTENVNGRGTSIPDALDEVYSYIDRAALQPRTRDGRDTALHQTACAKAIVKALRNPGMIVNSIHPDEVLDFDKTS